MNELLVACGDVELLKRILAELPDDIFKPIATKKGAGTAEKVANRQLVGAVVHAQLADGTASTLLEQLRQQQPDVPVLLLTPDNPPEDGPFDRAIRFPIPGPVFRNALTSLVDTESEEQDKDRWRAFYKEVKKRLNAAEQQSYYGLLGLSDGAPHHKIQKAFDKLSMRYHPDRYSKYTDEAWGKKLYAKVNALYKLLTEAYGVVSNRRLRKKYDQALQDGELRLDSDEASPSDQGPESLEDIGNTDKARRFLKMAQSDLAKGDTSSARQNLQFAASMEPDNEAIQQKLDELEG